MLYLFIDLFPYYYNLDKIFERIIMYNHLHKFIEENNLIYNLQFGYCQKHSISLQTGE